MALSRKADYALRAMVELSVDESSLISTKELAEKTQVPYAFMSKIVTGLAERNLVEILRGSAGGVRITADPSKTTALQVVEATSGRLYLNKCVSEPESCPRTSFCSMHPMLASAQKQLAKALSIDLRSLAKSQQRKLRKVS